MSQRLTTTVRHPLASAASSTPPQPPLGDETPGNNKEIPLGDETLGTKEYLHPLASAATSTQPQIPLGGETPRNNLLVSAATLAALASLGGRNPRDNKEELKLKQDLGEISSKDRDTAKPPRVRSKRKRRASLGGRNSGDRRRASLWGRNPRDNNNDKNETTKMMPNHQG